MKIHYKTLILNKDTEPELLGKRVLEKDKQYVIDYCCGKMEQAIKHGGLSLTGIELYYKEQGYNSLEDCLYPLNYCPFCGEKIEQLEEYRAKIEYYDAQVHKKTIPAHFERKVREVIVKLPDVIGTTLAGDPLIKRRPYELTVVQSASLIKRPGQEGGRIMQVQSYCSKCKKDTLHEYKVTGINHYYKKCSICGQETSR